VAKDNVGHKRSIKFTLKYLEQTKNANTEELWNSIKDLIIKSLISAQPGLSHIYRSC
jgi:tubulin polyglutamylase TTLL6/13